jgi:hypothetical protein
MSDFGLYNGLAVKSNVSDQINDLEHHDLRMQQNKALAEAKAKLFADNTKYQNAANSFDNKLIKQFADAKIKEIGRFYKENPDAMYNPDKRVVLESMFREIQDNEHTLRGVASDSAKRQLNADLDDMKKNPGIYDQEAYQDLLNQWNNYEKFGNQLGAEAAKNEGLKPFTFTPPPKFVPDLAKTLQGLGKGINQYDIQKNEDGDWWRTPDSNAVGALKTEAYQAHRRQLEVEAKRSGINNPQAIDKWVEDQIKSGFDKEYHVGDPDAKFRKQMAWAQLNEQKRHHAALEGAKSEQGKPFSSWDESFRNPNKPAGYADPQGVKAIIGDTPPIIVFDKSNGKQVDLTGKDFFPDNRYITSEGQKFLTGFVKLSKDEAEKYGIYKQGALTIDGVTNGFSGIASEEKGTDKEGKAYDYIKVKYQLPIDVNDKTLRARYDNTIQPDKTVDLQSSPQTKTWNGIPVGTIGIYKGKKVQITENGAVPVE